MRNDIEIHNLSKRYQIDHSSKAMYSTLRETWIHNAKRLARRLRHPFTPAPASKTVAEELWALRDINLSISAGDRAGIIGRNGAGKSTLLKILSKITSPTSGQVKIRGRVSSLLEVGTGFHPELTGKENIFLNGAILGMKRAEIVTKFQDIVDFAGVEKFLDTPVKRFSSGMIARLGFAVAAHLDPDILIIDEVLSVGDAQFQEKCLNKLNELGNSGRTVLFVSHDIHAVISLCNKGVFLEKGRVVCSGDVESCVSEYMKSYRSISMKWKGDVGNQSIRFYRAEIKSNDSRNFFYQDEGAVVEIEYEVSVSSEDIIICIGVWNQRNQLLARSSTFDDESNYKQYVQKGRHKATFTLPTGLFHEGEYLVKIECLHHHHRKIVDEEITLKYSVYSQGANVLAGYTDARNGVFLGNNWQLQ